MRIGSWLLLCVAWAACSTGGTQKPVGAAGGGAEPAGPKAAQGTDASDAKPPPDAGVTPDAASDSEPDAAALPPDAGAVADCEPTVERCDGFDNDCDDRTDEGDAEGCIAHHRDADGDGFGSAGYQRCLCEPFGPWVGIASDCDDANPAAFPFAVEACNGTDDDCDGRTDEGSAFGCMLHYADADGDGLGLADEAACLCAPGVLLRAAVAGDCNDSDAAVAPGHPELCDGIDNDCDGPVDEGATQQYYVDADADGWGTAPIFACQITGTLAVLSGDCAAGNPAIHPGALEVCDAADNDCDSKTDEGFAQVCVPVDTDNDGVVDGSDNCPNDANPQQQDLDVDGLGDVCDPDQDGDGSLDVDDCGPRDDTRAPGRAELCDNLDNDCDTKTDEGFALGAFCSAGVGACYETGMTICDLSGTGTGCSAVPGKPALEACNATDEDCDGKTDEGEICPDPTVANTLPFNGGVWYTNSTSTCGAVKLLQFWPTFDTSFYYSGFDCYARWWYFRPTDFDIFYGATFSGIWHHHEGTADELLPTPPCEAGTPFGFDASDRFYYRCQTSLRRDSGELIDNDISQIVAVLADGRVLVQRNAVLVMIDEDGTDLATFAPAQTYAGTLSLDVTATTVSGNNVFLLYSRSLPGLGYEILVLRIDASNSLLQVRRTPVAVAPPVGSSLVLSDGTVFWMERDPATTFDYQIRRLATNGSSTVVWREAETTFGVHIDRQLLIGPLRP